MTGINEHFNNKAMLASQSLFKNGKFLDLSNDLQLFFMLHYAFLYEFYTINTAVKSVYPFAYFMHLLCSVQPSCTHHVCTAFTLPAYISTLLSRLA